MMEERLGWLMVGVLIGYFARVLQTILKKVEHVDKQVSRDKEAGYATPQWLNNVALLLVVALTVFAAFTSQQSSNKSDDNTDQLVKSNSCNQIYTGKVIAALNARTQFSQEQTNANIELQKSQAVFLGGLLQGSGPPTTLDRKAIATYFRALTAYTTVASKSSKQVANNPYPTSKDFTDCLKGK